MKSLHDLNPTEKHLPLRIVCFVIALLIAVGAFTFGIGSLVKKKPGWYEIKAGASEGAPAGMSAFSLHYRFTGESDFIRQSKNELDSAYSNALSRTLKLLDARNLYEGYKNIAYINAHRGEDVAVSDDLYEILLDAVRMTEEKKGYSVFAGAVYGFWESIVMLEDPTPFDPVNDEGSAAYLAELSAPVAENTAATLTFNEAEKTVRLEVFDEYEALMQAYESEEPVLDLTVLHDAFVIRTVAKTISLRGYTGGYFQSESGVTLYRDGDTSGVFPLYAEKEGLAFFGAGVKMGNPTALCQWLSFPMTTGEYGTYTVVDDEKTTLHRSRYLACDGEPNSILLGAAAVVYQDDPVAAAYATLKLYDAEEEETLNRAVRENAKEGILSVYTISRLPDVFFVSDNANSFVKTTESAYRLHPVW